MIISLKRSFKADDRKAEHTTISILQNCLKDVKLWMEVNRLWMNEGKTEFIMFGTKKQLDKCTTTSIDVNNTEVRMSKVVKYFGMWMDSNLNFKRPYCEKVQNINDQHTANQSHQTISKLRSMHNPHVGAGHFSFGLL